MTSRGRVPHILLGVAALLVAALTLLYAADRAVLTYTLPPRPGATEPNRIEQWWPPGVAASVISGLAMAVSLGWLIWSIVRRPPRLLWVVPVAVTLSAVIVLMIVGGLQMPSF